MSHFLQSPPARFLIAAGALLAAGTYTPGSLESTDLQKYTPFNTLTVKNLSKVLLELTYKNNVDPTLVPAGSVVEIQEAGIIGFTLVNLDATTANDKQIEILMQRVVRPEHVMLAQLFNKKLCEVLNGDVGGGGC
ncbi:hypothetical protein [uncultured Methanoregula sp.]|uniref:hypothetical protein n=1 Tax=uncultured Methanoregula sp. TaxID=1005933 RepID=UPI002AAB52DF|nr:hypothetical protein [uncultured Methanoregula sp.]